jgi:hypothetical protein
MEGVVVIGKQPSAPENLYSETEIRKVVATISGSGVTLAPRGTTGKIFSLSFKKVGNSTPSHRAKNFITKLGRMQASRVMWAQSDRPKELRDHDRRARAFARAFKAKVVSPSAASKSPVFFTIEQGFLIINDSVIGPVTLIPEEDAWSGLFEVVFELIKNPKRHRIVRSKLLSLQLHKPIAKYLYDAFIAAPEEESFDEDDDMEDIVDLIFNDDLEVRPPPLEPFSPNIDLLAPLEHPTTAPKSN